MGKTTVRGGTYAVTADAGEIGLQAKLLVESIDRYDPDATVVTFVPSASIASMDTDRVKFFEERTELTTGKIPVPKYPPSALQRAFVEASERAATGPVLAVDSDAVMTAPVTLPSAPADLYARPAGLAGRYWGSERSAADWRVLFDYFDVTFPSETVYSYCDRRPFFVPFYNSGVVAATDPSLADEWLSVTEAIIEDVPIDTDEEFFVDQLALSVLAQRHDVGELTDLQNFQPRCRLRCPDDVEVIHYHNFANLRWISNLSVRRRLRALPTFEEIPTDHRPERVARLHLNRAYVFGSRVVPYPYNQYVRGVVQRAVSALKRD